MSNPKGRTGAPARAIVITDLGHKILRQVEAGTYQFAPRRVYIKPPAVLGDTRRKRK